MSAGLLTSKQVAERLGVTVSSVSRWVRNGWLLPTATTPGGVYRFSPDAVDEFFASHGDEPPAEAVAQ